LRHRQHGTRIAASGEEDKRTGVAIRISGGRTGPAKIAIAELNKP
jgi:hypothetical protein